MKKSPTCAETGPLGILEVMSGTILQRILETKRTEVAAARAAAPLESLRAAALSAAAPRDFYTAVTAPPPVRLIAEIKKASPSAGLIRADFDAVAIARTYEAAGAAALSVLTDGPFFQGRLGFIESVKAAVNLPVLRKDFLIDEYQLFESRAAGADAILLIAAALAPERIAQFSEIAAQLGMTTLIEVHDHAELQAIRRLLDRERRILLGINNRDLATQQIDLSTVERLSASAPGIAFVAESGLHSADDIARMQGAGACAVLIGEVFMRSPDIAAKVHSLFR